jgi:hypothetical protein
MIDSQVPLSPISAPLSDRDIGGPSSSDSLDAHLTFRARFLENFEAVRSRLSKSSRTGQSYLRYCKFRIEQESYQTRSSGKSANEIHDDKALSASDSPVASSIDVFRVNLLRKARLSKQYVDDVEKEVYIPLKSLLSEQDSTFDALEREGLDLVAALKLEYKLHDEALIVFDKRQRAAYDSLNHLDEADAIQSRIKLGSLCFLSSEDERQYHEAVMRVNEVRKGYLKSMSGILERLEHLESTRLQALRDAMDKMFIYEFALCRGTQYDLDCSFKEVEEHMTSSQDELLGFIKSAPMSAQGKPLSIEKGPVKIISIRDVLQPKIISPDKVSHELQSVEKKIIERIWGREEQMPVELRLDELEAVSEVFQDQSGRLSFCRALSLQKSELPTRVALENFSKVLNSLLTSAESDLDSETGRRVANFALKFFFFDASSGRKRYMQSEVYHHSLWNRILFWEEALALTLSDVFINQFIERVGGDIDSFPFSSGVSIEKFGTYLTVFGISAQSALEIVRRVMEKDEFGFLENDAKESIKHRLEESVRSAHERQERNLALIQSSVFSSKPTSPSLYSAFNLCCTVLFRIC